MAIRNLNVNVPITAQTVPQPKARIARLDPASSNRTFSMTPFSTNTCSCRFDAANVLLNPAIAATPATDARNIPAEDRNKFVIVKLMQSQNC